jgi:hypothetical protein
MRSRSGMASRRPEQVLASLVLMVALLTSCDSVGRSEVRRIPSPDSRVEAVLVEGSGGATTDFFYEIHVVPKGTGLQPKEDPVVRMANVGAMDNLSIEWRRPNLLAIAYKQGWIQRFTNRWSGKDGKGSYVVELKLVPPAGDDFALPERQRF